MEIDILGHISLYDMMIYFFIFSFVGWILEIVYHALKNGKFVNRGFLNGPVCPIYGIGMAVTVLLLNKLTSKWWLLFLVGMSLATILEFVTGFILEKIFNTKWWDYSKEPFNIKGYVCLKFSLIWGIAILVAFYTIVPLTDKLISFIPYKWWGFSILIVCWTLFIVDFICTIIQLKNFGKMLKEATKVAEIIHKSSNIIGEKVSESTITLKEKLSILTKKFKNHRINKAFPKLNEKLDNIRLEIKQKRNKKKNYIKKNK